MAKYWDGADPVGGITKACPKRPVSAEQIEALAERVMKLEPADEKTRCATAFRLLTSRKPADTEIAVMCKILQTQRDYFQAHPQEALDLRTNGRHPADASLPPAEVAATSMLIRSLMSHVESVTR